MGDIVGTIPEFSEGSMENGEEEVKETMGEQLIEETDTPAELPADEQENVDQKPAQTGDNTDNDPVLDAKLAKATEGLRKEIVGLRNKVNTLTGGDRKLAQEQLVVTQQKLDDLADVNPADVALIEKVIKSKGYVTKDEAQAVNYDTVQKQVLATFLDKYPEYKPENDPENTNWNRLVGEYGLYAKPRDPMQIATLLERSHKATAPIVSDRNLPEKKRALQVASAGSGGKGKSSSGGTPLTAQQRLMYEQGGWSAEEIDAMENSH